MFRLYFPAVPIEDWRVMSSQYHLIVVIPDQEPISYSITGEKITLGRAPDNDIQLLVAEISTHHCEFSKGGDGYQIIDVGSSNGTRVKGQSITNGRVFLNDRDMILLGETIPSYFVYLEEGAELNPKEIIQSIEEANEEKEVREAAPVLKAPKLPTFKPAAPTADATQVEESQSGASTVVLKKIPSLKAVPHVAAKKEAAPAIAAPVVAGKVPPVAKKKEAPKLKLPQQQDAPAVKKLPIRKLPKLSLPKNPGES